MMTEKYDKNRTAYHNSYEFRSKDLEDTRNHGNKIIRKMDGNSEKFNVRMISPQGRYIQSNNNARLKIAREIDQNRNQEGLNQINQSRNDDGRLKMMIVDKDDSDSELEYVFLDSDDINMSHSYPESMMTSHKSRPLEVKRYVQNYDQQEHVSQRPDMRAFVDAAKMNHQDRGAFVSFPEQLGKWEMPVNSHMLSVDHTRQPRPRSAPKERMIVYDEYSLPREIVQTNMDHPRVQTDTGFPHRNHDNMYIKESNVQLKHHDFKLINPERKHQSWKAKRPKMQKSMSFDISSQAMNANYVPAVRAHHVNQGEGLPITSEDRHKFQMLRDGFRPVENPLQSERRWIPKSHINDDTVVKVRTNRRGNRSFHTISPHESQKAASSLLNSEYCDDPGLLDIPSLSPGYEDFCDIYYEEEIKNHDFVKHHGQPKLNSLTVNVIEEVNDEVHPAYPISQYPTHKNVELSDQRYVKGRIRNEDEDGLINDGGMYHQMLQNSELGRIQEEKATSLGKQNRISDIQILNQDAIAATSPGSSYSNVPPGNHIPGNNANNLLKIHEFTENALSRQTPSGDQSKRKDDVMGDIQRHGSVKLQPDRYDSNSRVANQPDIEVADTGVISKSTNVQHSPAASKTMDLSVANCYDQHDNSCSEDKKINKSKSDRKLARNKNYETSKKKGGLNKPDSQFKNNGFWYHFATSTDQRSEAHEAREEQRDDRDSTNRKKNVKNKAKKKDSSKESQRKKKKEGKKSKTKKTSNLCRNDAGNLNGNSSEKGVIFEVGEIEDTEKREIDSADGLKVNGQINIRQKDGDLEILSKRELDEQVKQRLLELAAWNGGHNMTESNQADVDSKEVEQRHTSARADVRNDLQTDTENSAYFIGDKAKKVLKRSMTVGCFPVDYFCIHCRQPYLSSFFKSFQALACHNPKAEVHIQHARKQKSISINPKEEILEKESTLEKANRLIQNEELKDIQKKNVDEKRRKSRAEKRLGIIHEEKEHSRKSNEHKSKIVLKNVTRNSKENNKTLTEVNKIDQSSSPSKKLSIGNEDVIVVSDEEAKKSIIANLIRRRRDRSEIIKEEQNTRTKDVNNNVCEVINEKNDKTDAANDKDVILNKREKEKLRKKNKYHASNNAGRSQCIKEPVLNPTKEKTKFDKEGKEKAKEEVISDEENKRKLISNLIRKRKDAVIKKPERKDDIKIQEESEANVISDEDNKRNVISNLIRKKREARTKASEIKDASQVEDQKKEDVISDEENKKKILANLLRKKKEKCYVQQQERIKNGDQSGKKHKLEISNGRTDKMISIKNESELEKEDVKESGKFVEITATEKHPSSHEIPVDNRHKSKNDNENGRKNGNRKDKGTKLCEATMDSDSKQNNLRHQEAQAQLKIKYANENHDRKLSKYDKKTSQRDSGIDRSITEIKDNKSENTSNDEISSSESADFDSSVDESSDDADHEVTDDDDDDDDDDNGGDDVGDDDDDEDDDDDDEDDDDDDDEDESTSSSDSGQNSGNVKPSEDNGQSSEDGSLILELASIDSSSLESYSTSEDSEESDDEARSKSNKDTRTASDDEYGESLSDDSEEQTESSEDEEDSEEDQRTTSGTSSGSE